MMDNSRDKTYIYDIEGGGCSVFFFCLQLSGHSRCYSGTEVSRQKRITQKTRPILKVTFDVHYFLLKQILKNLMIRIAVTAKNINKPIWTL